MFIKLPIELANQIIGYLGTRPYQEVWMHIQAMQEAAKPQIGPDGAPRQDNEGSGLNEHGD